MFEDFQPYTNCEPAGVILPKISLEGRLAGLTPFEALRELCLEGVKTRGINKQKDKRVYYDRVKHELDIIEELGFTDYMLLNWDIIKFCHDNDIPVGEGRGSAAGSLVLYLIEVTNIDPIKYNLFFERFISKSRAKKIVGDDGVTYLDGSLLCDVDNDISYEHRAKVVEYIEKKYKGKTSKILTFNTLSSKSCIRELTKYFDKAKKEEADYVSSLIPKNHGKVAPLSQAEEESEEFKGWVKEHKETFKVALILENLVKNAGVHPSGIAICHKPIEDIMPTQKTKDGDLVSAYDMDDVAALMVKFDILGLRTLSVVDRTCRRLGIDVSSINPEDEVIYKVLQDYRYPQGLFQISADTNFKAAQKVKPENLSELSDVLALSRPGSLAFIDDYVEQKDSPQPLTNLPQMDEILSPSKNILLYQEQAMAIANKVFGFSLEEAEVLRRIIGKKKVEEMPAWKEKIYDAGEELRIPIEICDFYWKVLEDSANYSFNLSHSVAYATLSAKTIYLKFQYPKEFFCSLLEMAEFEQEPLKVVAAIQEELPFFGIRLLPPNLRKSTLGFHIEGNDIRYGFSSIKGVSDKTHEALKKFSEQGEFSNKYEIFLAAKAAGLNIGVLSALIYSGCLGLEKRHRLALEAQAFNLLTDREKRNLTLRVEELGDDVLTALDKAYREQIMADSGGVIIKESRFKTFTKKFQKYKELYLRNSKYLKFCSWYFEKFLLGYSYSYSLRECFEDRFEALIDVSEIENLSPGAEFKCVGEVQDPYVNISANRNRYMRFKLSDGNTSIFSLFCDQRDKKPLSEFLKTNNLTDGDIVVVSGSTGNDGTPFVNHMKAVNTQIYTNIRQLNES